MKRVTKRKDSKKLKPEEIMFESFPQKLPKDIKSVEQIEVLPEKEFDETVFVEITEQIIEESGKKLVKKMKMRQTKPEEVTFETLPELVEQKETIVEEIEVVPSEEKKDAIQVTHSLTEETGKRALKRITKKRKSISEVTFESIPEIIKQESIAQKVIEVLPELDKEESVSVEIIETIIDEKGKKTVKKVKKLKEIVPRDASFDTLRDILLSQDDENVGLKKPKKVTLKKKKPEEEKEIVETIEDTRKQKKIVKKLKKPKPEMVEGVIGKLKN